MRGRKSNGSCATEDKLGTKRLCSWKESGNVISKGDSPCLKRFIGDPRVGGEGTPETSLQWNRRPERTCEYFLSLGRGKRNYTKVKEDSW